LVFFLGLLWELQYSSTGIWQHWYLLRLLSHRSFQVPKWLEYAIATLERFSSRRANLLVAGHRLHHAYTEDEDKDPYSSKRGFGGAICSGFCTHVQFFEPETTKDCT